MERTFRKLVRGVWVPVEFGALSSGDRICFTDDGERYFGPFVVESNPSLDATAAKYEDQ